MIRDILCKRDFFADIIIITTFLRKYKGGDSMKIKPDYQLSVLHEETYKQKMSEISAQLDGCRKEGDFQGFDGQMLHYEFFQAQDSRGAVVVAHGMSEFSGKYHEFAWYLLNQGYDVFLYDQRGHGRSCRLTERLNLIHVDCFSDYWKDLDCFVRKVVQPNTEGPLYLYAHSMGGAVAAQYLANRPQVFRKAVLSAPMIRPLTGQIAPEFAWLSMSVCVLFGAGKRQFWLSDEFDPNYPFEHSHDRSRARFERNMEYRLQNPCCCTTPQTIRWVQQAVGIYHTLTRKRFLKRIQTPILMISAENDGSVCDKAQQKFARNCPRCRRIVLMDTTHAMLCGTQETITRHLQAVLEHFA